MRAHSPFLTEKAWEPELMAAGFIGLESEKEKKEGAIPTWPPSYAISFPASQTPWSRARNKTVAI